MPSARCPYRMRGMDATARMDSAHSGRVTVRGGAARQCSLDGSIPGATGRDWKRDSRRRPAGAALRVTVTSQPAGRARRPAPGVGPWPGAPQPGSRAPPPAPLAAAARAASGPSVPGARGEWGGAYFKQVETVRLVWVGARLERADRRQTTSLSMANWLQLLYPALSGDSSLLGESLLGRRLNTTKDTGDRPPQGVLKQQYPVSTAGCGQRSSGAGQGKGAVRGRAGRGGAGRGGAGRGGAGSGARVTGPSRQMQIVGTGTRRSCSHGEARRGGRNSARRTVRYRTLLAALDDSFKFPTVSLQIL
jgi:hypothetical protein